jgi:predicted transcriptional regulator of viral defense system
VTSPNKTQARSDRFPYVFDRQVDLMALADTYRRRLRDRALDQYGYVTTRDAAAVGVPAVELRKIAQRGGVDHVAYGLYRFDDVPRSGRDQYMEAVLRVGPDAYLTHDAVLALYDLGLVNPQRIRVGTARRTRPRLPSFVEIIHRQLDPKDLTDHEGIPCTTVGRALLDCRGIVMGERLVDATREAARRGLLRRDECDRVLAELGVAQ